MNPTEYPARKAALWVYPFRPTTGAATSAQRRNDNPSGLALDPKNLGGGVMTSGRTPTDGVHSALPVPCGTYSAPAVLPPC